MIRAVGCTCDREGSVVAVILHKSVTEADIDDTRGVPDSAFNPHSFLGAAELSGRQLYRERGHAAISAAISTVVDWSMIMERVHFLKDTCPASGVVKVIKRGGEPFMVYFTDEAHAEAFQWAITATTNERIARYETEKILDMSRLKEFWEDRATQADMDDVVTAIEKIRDMTTEEMIWGLEAYGVHPSGSAARIIVGSTLAELILARDYGMTYLKLAVHGTRTPQQLLSAREGLKPRTQNGVRL